MPEFRPQQQLALDYPGNVAVSAGAGSGKTRVLVEKYFRLLAYEHPDWPLNSVVAVTFTIKAASELRARIVERIREESGRPGLPLERRARLREMRQQIAAAPIGTIHNFCSRLLREFSEDAGISPDFAILEGPREKALRSEAVETVLTEAAAMPGTQAYHDLLSLLSLYSRRALGGMLEGMLSRRSEFISAARRYQALTIDELFEELRVVHGEQITTRRAQIAADASGIASDIARAKLPSKWPGLGEFIAEWENARAEQKDWGSVCAILGRLNSSLFTVKGELRKKAESALGLGDTDPLVVRIKELCVGISAAGLGDLGEADRENLEIARMIAGLFLRTVGVHARARSAGDSISEIDLLDFTDLEMKAELLISKSAEIRERLRGAIRFLIVDEFQDTSDGQWRILGPLVCGDDGAMLPSRFFMVGDPKQGIYGFRHAGGGIFGRVEKLVEESNHGHLDSGNGLVQVSENFRTLPGPLGFVNDLFAALMPGDSNSEHEVRFEPLKARRMEGEGSVEVMIASGDRNLSGAGDSDEEDEVESADEARMASLKISEIVSSGQASVGDIAVLFRKRKHFGEYETALRQRGIPFVTHRGKGLYEQPEISDLLALLRMLISPANDLNTVQVLRGSLFNFTDDLLLKISKFEGSGFWAKCIAASRRTQSEPITLASYERGQLSFAVEQIQRLGGRAGLIRVDGLLNEIIERTGALAIYGATDRAAQAIANIQKLMDIARDLQMTDVEDFLGFAEGQADDPRGEGEATPEFLGSEAVKLMTIHAAKGLEFPVVFLAQLGDKAVSTKRELLGDGTGWFTVRKTRGAVPEGTFLHSWLSQIEGDRSKGEEKRILYVAATRCRDHLYLCANGGEVGAGSFFSQVVNFLACQSGPLKSSVSITRCATDKETAVFPTAVRLHDGVFEQRVAERRASFGLGGEGASVPSQVPIVDLDLPPFAPASIRLNSRLEISAEQFADYVFCPLEFFGRHVAGTIPNLPPGATLLGPHDELRDIVCCFGNVMVNARINVRRGTDGEGQVVVNAPPGSGSLREWDRTVVLGNVYLAMLWQVNREKKVCRACIVKPDLSKEETVSLDEHGVNALLKEMMEKSSELSLFAEQFGSGSVLLSEGNIRMIEDYCRRRACPCKLHRPGARE